MRLRRSRRRPSGARPGSGPGRRTPGSGRTAAAGGVRTTPGGPGRVSAALTSHPRPTSLLLRVPNFPGENRSPTASVACPARGRARGDAARGPAAALTARLAERDRYGETARDRASYQTAEGPPGLSRGAARRRWIRCRAGWAGIRTAAVGSPPSASNRPEVGRSRRSLRSLSSPADYLSVTGRQLCQKNDRPCSERGTPDGRPGQRLPSGSRVSGPSGLVEAIEWNGIRHARDTQRPPSGRCPPLPSQGGPLRPSRTNCLV
jgi:hypothetical protein